MRYTLFFVTALLLLGCDKVIDMDYRSIDSKIVIEGRLTQHVIDYGSDLGYPKECKVTVSKSRDMNSTEPITYITDAKVSLTIDGGTEVLDLEFDGDNYILPDLYAYSDTPLPVDVGYTIEVEVDGEKYTSRSQLNSHVQMTFEGFEWIKTFADAGMLMCKSIIYDTPNVENFYLYTVYVNDELYSWNVTKDNNRDGMPITMNSYLRTYDNNIDEEESDEIYVTDGDYILVSCEAIDKPTYDYFYSLSINNTSYSNPITNFSGGCLGYFYCSSATTDGEVLDASIIVP